MPKKVKSYDDDEEDEDDEEYEDDVDDEELEKEEKKGRGRPSPIREKEKVIPPRPARHPGQTPKKRYMVMNMPPRVGIVDAETNEVIAEGELGIHMALADIIERLERIESNQGNMM